MVAEQGGIDWMTLRPWRFSSTSFHMAINVRFADYFEMTQLRVLHEEAKTIIQLNPTTDVTLANVATTEDETLPSQRSGLFARLSRSSQGSHHSNCTAEYWLKNGGSRKKLGETCRKNGIGKTAHSVLISFVDDV